MEHIKARWLARLAEWPAGRAVSWWRLGWIAAALLIVGDYGASITALHTGLLRAPAPALRAALAALHISASTYAAYVIGLGLVAALGYWVIALLILVRADTNHPAPLVAFMLVAFGAALPGTTYALATQTPIWAVPHTELQAIGWVALMLFACVFPDGRFVAPWSRLGLLGGGAWVAVFFLVAGWLAQRTPAWIAGTLLIWVVWFAGGVLAQGYRYVRAASPTQRQQTKWVVLGFVVAITGALAAVVPHALLLVLRHPPLTLGLVQFYMMPVLTLAAFAIPVSVAIAILRHQLFDIDFIIRRTLVYGTLSAALVLIFEMSVIATRALVDSIAGAASQAPATIVVSTLAVSALFRPLHERVQTGIDQRFYRRKYDAERTLAEFAASLRTEFDLVQLQHSLLAVVDRTMQPDHVSLWLRRPAARPQEGPPPLTE